jgi:hypothetical protein
MGKARFMDKRAFSILKWRSAISHQKSAIRRELLALIAEGRALIAFSYRELR